MTNPQKNLAKERRKIVAATVVGTTVEWYDFFIYAFAANLVFQQLFFGPAGPQVGQLAALASIGLSFLFRPLGAFLAGHFGDRLGRRPMLVITLLLMGVATVAVGLLPTYETIGIAAPILLLLCRILQGISAGGEWGGAVLMAVEHAPQGRRGLFGQFPQLGVPFGMLLASGVLALMQVVTTDEQWLAWGWRVPFISSIVLIFVGFWVRRTVEESPVFSEMQDIKAKSSAPIAVLFKAFAPFVIFAAFVFAGNNAVGYMITGGFVQGYASRPVDADVPGLGFDGPAVQMAVLVAAAMWAIATAFGGWLSDIIGRRNTYLIGYVILAITAVPLFELVKQGPVMIGVAGCLLAVGLGLTYGPQAAWYAEVFPASVRFSGVSISYAIGAVIGGAFSPLIAQWLMDTFDGNTWAIVPYLLLMVVIGIIGSLLLRERRDIPLTSQIEVDGEWETWSREKVQR
ncbi:MFS transporter [uncultured Agrococcus sp.]|uniref:MFS transporter n=1 Tax=uncultured Agrococcus sp. TaxID=382258 RepID=UPI0025F04A86|nr:MFS transporter [uncultured Agrococcus sp.]